MEHSTVWLRRVAIGVSLGLGGLSGAQHNQVDNLLPSPRYWTEDVATYQMPSGAITVTNLAFDVASGRVPAPELFVHTWLAIRYSIRYTTRNGSFAVTGNGQLHQEISIVEPTRYFIHSLDWRLGDHGALSGLTFRLDPKSPSLGYAYVTPISGGYRVVSRISLNTQLSIDGGQTWSDTARQRFTGVPEPASASVLLLGGLGILARSRKARRPRRP